MGLIGTLARFILIALAVWALYRVLRNWMTGAQATNANRARMNGRRKGEGEVLDVMVQDPQCGTYVPKHEALRVLTHGQERYFCSEACRDAFLAAAKAQEQKRKAQGA